MTRHETQKQAPKDADDEYDSADDEDFKQDDSDGSSRPSSPEPGSPKQANDLDSGDEATLRTRAPKRKGEHEDTVEILTRAQKRARDAELAKPATETAAKQDKPADLESVWQQLNAKPASPDPSAAALSEKTDTVRINRTYEFAGQVITEVKDVPRDSAEAKAHLSSLHAANHPSKTAKPPVRRPLKRAPKLEAMAQQGKPPKLNVLEKSRLDWAGFVDREGIHDDLKRYNKDGYVERQEFLKRTR